MLFLFIFNIIIHNNKGDKMKRIILLILIFIDNVYALGNVYISKKDVNTNQYLTDCDFSIYDANGHIVDSWIPNGGLHISTLNSGEYSLVERPFVMGVYHDDLSKVYKLDVKEDSFYEFTIYNNKIDVPDNLSASDYKFGYLFLIIGCFFLLFGLHGKFYKV